MFIFHRLRRGTTEVFDILLSENGLSEAEDRFGRAVRYGLREERYHSVGMVILIHDEKETEFFLACKSELEETEYAQLHQELEHLTGQELHALGSEPTIGWYEHDYLRSYQPPEPPKKRGKKK